MSQQQVQYIILTFAVILFLALAMWQNIHFIWAALISALLISQSAVTGWTPRFKIVKLPDNPNHNLKSLLTCYRRPCPIPGTLKVIEPMTETEPPQSFASYQQLKARLEQHQEDMVQLNKHKSN